MELNVQDRNEVLNLRDEETEFKKKVKKGVIGTHTYQPQIN